MSSNAIIPDDVMLRRAIPLPPMNAAPDPSAPAIATGAPPPGLPIATEPQPAVMSKGLAGGTPVVPATKGNAIPISSSTGKPEQLNDKGIPIRAGVAGLWAKADNIHNPILRILGKVGAGAARAIDTAGRIAAPGIEENIPGSSGNEAIQTGKLAAKQAQDAKVGLETAQTANQNAEAQQRLNPQPKQEEAGKTITTDQGVMQWNPETQRYDIRAGGEAAKDDKPIIHESDQGIFMVDPKTKQVTPLTMNGQPLMPKTAPKNTAEQLKSKIQQAYEAGDKAQVASLQNELKAIDPEGAQRLVIAMQNQELQKTKASRQDIREHDKAYVQPAETVEKSYQMMNDAYNEYEAARKAGKELPTGAQSMLALSTHLSTTFGNVKGARVTKDMIHEHLGARSISDDALVAIQKLTNGDQLSPAQWTAFHDLISRSRNLSWQIATKEAKRKDIPIDFLPEDLQGLSGDQQGAPDAPPPGAKVRDYSHLK